MTPEPPLPSLTHRIRSRVARRAERILTVLNLVEPREAPADDVVGAPLHSLPTEPLTAPPEPAVEPEPVAVAAPEPAVAAGDGDAPRPLTAESVQEVFDDMVRPALQADGGDITLVKVEAGDVYVRMVGACSSCPSSTATMRYGIERLLREEFPDFGDLVAVGDYEIV
ncbi:MAG: Fe-S cluster biogenesis protein NfuA [Myxococcota bacterium]